MRLIDADVYEKILTEWMPDHQGEDDIENTVGRLLYDCIAQLHKMPTVSPESLKPQGRWIRVKDRLPEDDDTLFFIRDGVMDFTSVLVFNGTVRMSNRLNVHNKIGIPIKKTDGWQWSVCGEVTHWMPLPNPPKGVL